jgi:prepilin signal peptidase PulO-like enzyme (type II secretory pathway)
LLIELVCTIGLPLFYFWQVDGGLVGGLLNPLPLGWFAKAEVWFWLHSVLLALMLIATFIDFDERTIPDYVTVPGTVFAILMAVIFPESRLPEVTANLAGSSIMPISFANGAPLSMFEFLDSKLMARGANWHQAGLGLMISLIVWWGWVFALLPKITTLRYGLSKGVWLMWVSCLRPRRKQACPVRVQQRKPYLETVVLLGLGILGTAIILLVKQYLPTAKWDSLFQALFGLGFGGLMIWGIRIVGQLALQREAMGFGDVTLMAMVGAFLGWQVTLLALPIAAILALGVTVVSIVFTRDSQLAFGPYLCMGTAIVLFTWHSIWPATQFYFSLGEWLFVMLGVMLLMMLVMLFGLQALKRLIGLSG